MDSYKRRPTREVFVGKIGVGGNNPIRLQSMTTTDTMDTESVERVIVVQHTLELGTGQERNHTR